MSLRRVCKDSRLITQIRSDQHRNFVFRTATERAQVKQDNLPSHNNDSDFDINMSQTNCLQTTNFKDWRSESHNCSLDLCSLTIKDGDPQTVRAPTPEYVAPLPYVPPKGLEIHSVEEIEAMWAKWNKNSCLNPSKRISSNKDIQWSYRDHQDYLERQEKSKHK